MSDASSASLTDWIDALLSTDGQALLSELAEHPTTRATEIAVITRLRERYASSLVTAAVEQAALRARARSKFSNAAEMYFTRPGLEQASSERMARHHAQRYSSFARMADLCTGIGGDLIGLAGERAVLAVDVDPVHARLSQLNAAANSVGSAVTTLCADVRDLAFDDIPAVFIDPARRSTDRRFSAGASEPSLAWCFSLAHRGTSVGVKAAPGLPADLVPGEWELEFVSEHRELKESALWSPSLATAGRRATLLPGKETLVDRPGADVSVDLPGRYLIDPDPAVTRAGLVKELGASLGECWQIDDQIAFLSANNDLRTPFGRTLEVHASEPWSLARLKQILKTLNVGSVDIRKRGSAVDVDELQRRFKLRGTRSATIVLTRASDRPWMLVCFEPSARGPGKVEAEAK